MKGRTAADATAILVTGGAGFIGSHTVDALIERGHRVRVLDILDPQIHGERAAGGFPAYLHPQAEAIEGDVADPSTLARALDGVDAVYHFAAKTGVGQSMYDIASYVDTNVRGTAVLIEALVRRDRPLSRLVLASSRAVYGEGAATCAVHGVVSPALRHRSDLEKGDFETHCPDCGRPLRSAATTEDAPLAPASIYALTKKVQEELCLQAATAFSLPVTILRYFNVYGSRQALRNPYTGVATVFFNRLREDLPVSMYERGRPTRDFVHVADVVAANLAALSTPTAPGCCINVGSGHATTIRELAETMAQVLDVELQLEDRGAFRVGDVFACTADLRRARELLGYSPKVDLVAGLTEFLDWAGGDRSGGGAPFEQTEQELERYGLLGRAGPAEPD